MEAWRRPRAGRSAGRTERFARASLESERRWLPEFDRVLVTSCNDAKLVQAIAPDAKVTVYPNALPLVPPPRGRSGRKSYSAAIWNIHRTFRRCDFFSATIWPALAARWPGLKWKILSKNPGLVRDWPASDPHIEITGFVEDAVAVIAQSQVAVVPLLAGSGTRIKILEAWAAGTPVVSTTLGAEGLECRDREHLVLADDAESFTAAVSGLLALPVQSRAHRGRGAAAI